MSDYKRDEKFFTLILRGDAKSIPGNVFLETVKVNGAEFECCGIGLGDAFDEINHLESEIDRLEQEQ